MELFFQGLVFIEHIVIGAIRIHGSMSCLPLLLFAVSADIHFIASKLREALMPISTIRIGIEVFLLGLVIIKHLVMGAIDMLGSRIEPLATLKYNRSFQNKTKVLKSIVPNIFIWQIRMEVFLLCLVIIERLVIGVFSLLWYASCA